MVTVRVNVPITLAVITGELVSLIWYHYSKDNDRYLLTAIICDVLLTLAIHYILKHYWVFSGWLDGVQMGVAIGFLFFSLQAPHHVYGPKSFVNFFLHTLQKSLQVIVISSTLFYARKLKWPWRKREVKKE